MELKQLGKEVDHYFIATKLMYYVAEVTIDSGHIALAEEMVKLADQLAAVHEKLTRVYEREAKRLMQEEVEFRRN